MTGPTILLMIATFLLGGVVVFAGCAAYFLTWIAAGERDVNGEPERDARESVVVEIQARTLAREALVTASIWAFLILTGIAAIAYSLTR